jgi:hypothetical protein
MRKRDMKVELEMNKRVLEDITSIYTRKQLKDAKSLGGKAWKDRRTIYACPYADPRTINLIVNWLDGYYKIWK